MKNMLRFLWTALAPGGLLAWATLYGTHVAWLVYGGTSAAALLMAIGMVIGKENKR